MLPMITAGSKFFIKVLCDETTTCPLVGEVRRDIFLPEKNQYKYFQYGAAVKNCFFLFC